MCSYINTNTKQECIPVGCVPAAHWPYAWVCFLGVGCLLLGGGCLLLGVPPYWGGASFGGVPPSWGGLLLWGVPPSWGGLLWQGVSFLGCLLLGGLLLWGSPSWGGPPSWRVSLAGGVPPSWGGSPWQGGIPACTEADTPLWTKSHTAVKTLPWPQLRLRAVKTYVHNLTVISHVATTIFITDTLKSGSLEKTENLYLQRRFKLLESYD